MLKEDNLPIHLEAGALAQDPSDAGALYAVYSLTPYSEVWRTAIEARNLLRRPDAISLAGRIGFSVLAIVGGALVARFLVRSRFAGWDEAADDDGGHNPVAATPAPADDQRRAGVVVLSAAGMLMMWWAAPAARFVEHRMPGTRDAPMAIAAAADGTVVHHRSGRRYRSRSQRTHRLAADPGAEL